MTPRVSVIIRARDKADVLGRAIESVRRQTVASEIVVVDSGSRDGSLQIAESAADHVVSIPASAFSFGRALNIGAARASAPVHVALSAHCALPDTEWLARASAVMDDLRVGAACGRQILPDGDILRQPVRLDVNALRRRPRWSLSNHASVWRAEAWRACPFDEDLGASEDLVFALGIAERGWQVLIDPDLFVPAAHRHAAGPMALFARKRVETSAAAAAMNLTESGLQDALRWWWRDVARRPDQRRVLARLNPIRVAAFLGMVAGYRDAGTLYRARASTGQRESSR